jgi:hypothetical protein
VSLDIASASDVSMDTLALVTAYRAVGHHAAETSAGAFAPIPPNAPDSATHEYPMYWLAAVDVLSSSAVGTIVAVGDSWIDGRCSTTADGRVLPDLYQRWIDVLAARLAAERPNEPTAVVNAGIAGNRIIPGGGNGPPLLQRLDRDVLERAGATHVMFLQGMNDIGGGAAATQIIAAMQQIIDRVHARGLLIVGGTLFPLARPDRARWTREMEAQRLAVNGWIRTQAGFDGVIDFDRLMSGGPVYGESQSLKAEFSTTCIQIRRDTGPWVSSSISPCSVHRNERRQSGRDDVSHSHLAALRRRSGAPTESVEHCAHCAVEGMRPN